MCARMIQNPHLIAFLRQSLDEKRGYTKRISVTFALFTEKDILKEFKGKGKSLPKGLLKIEEVDPSNPNKTMLFYYVPWTPNMDIEWWCYPKSTLSFSTELEMREHLFRGQDQVKDDQGLQRFKLKVGATRYPNANKCDIILSMIDEQNHEIDMEDQAAAERRTEASEEQPAEERPDEEDQEEEVDPEEEEAKMATMTPEELEEYRQAMAAKLARGVRNAARDMHGIARRRRAGAGRPVAATGAQKALQAATSELSDLTALQLILNGRDISQRQAEGQQNTRRA